MASEDDLYDEMDAWVAGDALTVPTEELEPPEDAAQANVYLRVRERLVRDAARVAEVTDAEIASLAAFRDDRLYGIRRRVEHLDRLLEGWMRAVNKEDPKRKTVTLPHGELKLRGAPWRVEVVDEDALAAWLWANDPERLKIEFKPRLGDLKAMVVTDPKDPKQKDRPLRLAGVSVSEGPDEAWWEMVTDDGEPIPGVRLARATRDNFTVR